MSTSHKGTLTVVVATVVTSGMILLSESGIAETKNQASTGISSASANESTKGNAGTVIQQDANKKNIIIHMPKKDVALAPPPGPFLNEELSENSQQKITPIAPTQAVYKAQVPISPVNSLGLKAIPAQSRINLSSKAELTPPLAPLKPSFWNVKQHNSPKLSKRTREAPSSEQTPNLSKKVPSPPQYNGQSVMIPPNAPIWSQKGQGTNFKSNNSRVSPNNSGAVMNNNFGWGYPIQQYMYVPVPMMPSTIVAPQMPVFNRTPAPRSNYWVPTPRVNKSLMQKNVPKKDNN